MQLPCPQTLAGQTTPRPIIAECSAVMGNCWRTEQAGGGALERECHASRGGGIHAGAQQISFRLGEGVLRKAAVQRLINMVCAQLCRHVLLQILRAPVTSVIVLAHAIASSSSCCVGKYSAQQKLSQRQRQHACMGETSRPACMQHLSPSVEVQGTDCLTSLVGSTPLGSNCSRWPREMLTAKRSHQGI